MKKTLTLVSGLLLLALVFSWWWSSRQPKPVELIPTLTGQPEYCITCHADVPDISPSHPNKTFGCVSCHGGERLALNADLAHSTMRGGANPSDLSVVEISCGGSNCHSGSEADNRNHIQRVMTSVQSTYAGAIASIRYTFGAQANLNAYLGIKAITDEETKTGIKSLSAFDPSSEINPSIQKFGKDCLTCHLNTKPREENAYVRSTGCAACHATAKHALSTAIPYTQCNACQKCEYTLDCEDCHTRNEAMGDGDIHANQKDIQYIQCKTCHGTPTELPLTKTLTDLNDIAFRLAFLNAVVNLKPGDTILVTEKDEPLWNTRVLADGTYELVGKATKENFTFRPVMGSHCTQSGKDQSSTYCHECHSVER